MKTELIQTKCIDFSCGTNMTYGQPISILSKPEISGAMWAARAFCSRYGVTEIFLRDPNLPGDVFLILSCQPSDGSLYSCRAVLARDLERDSDRIEQDIVSLPHK